MFFLFRKVQTASGPTGPPFNGYWGSFSGLKRLVRDINHSASSSVEARNEWRYKLIPTLYLYCVDKEKFFSQLNNPRGPMPPQAVFQITIS
jgi:hypothetical protein